MALTLMRLDQLRKTSDPDDTLSASAISSIETSAVDHFDFLQGLLSQIKRIVHGDDSGNWHDDIATAFGEDASLKALVNRNALSDQLALFNRLNLSDVAVPATQNYVALTSGGKPDRNIAIANTQRGAVVAQLSTAIGSHALDENSGSNTLKPKNLLYIFDGATGDALLSSGRRIYGLLQVGSSATDGNPFGDSGNDQAQISFVRPNATYDDLEACPVADIESQSIIYAFSERNDLASFAEDAWRGDLESADPSASVSVSLDSAYDGGTFMTVDGSDVDIRLADTKSWVFRKGSGGAILWQLTRDDAGTDTLQIASAVDSFDVDAADSDFAQGATFDSADQSINVGKTAVGVIDSSTLETRATTGNNEVSAPNGEVQFQTVREATALPLDDATAGAISGLFSQSFASVSAAIKYAGENGGVDLSVKTFVAASNYAQDANIPGATLDLTSYSLDMNTPSGVDLFLFLNGRLLYGGNGTTNNDVYAGDTPSNGDVKVDFPKGIKSGDVIISIGLQQ